jgi:hypothetical protein
MPDGVSHDQNFKNLILDYPQDALAFFAAEEAPLAEDTVEIIPARQEQLQERLGEHYRELDVPLLVTWQDGRREAILFVLEEETDWRRFSLHRLAHYCLDLADLYKMDRVVPVVIFLRDADAAPGTLTLGSERHAYLTFDYLACKLNAMPFEHWQDSDNLVARLNLPNMQCSDAQKIEVYARAINGLLALEPDWDKRAKYVEFIDIYAGLTDNELRRFQQQYPEANDTMAGFFQRARNEAMQQGLEQGLEQGREQGREQGIEQGRVEGQRAVLERLLQHRFGHLSPEIMARLTQASRSELEAWADNVLDAGTLDDVFDLG